MFTEKDNTLYAHLTFPDFISAFAFMTKVGEVAEKMNHHPKWTNVYNSVEIRLTTHDADNTVTDLDHALASEIEKIYLSSNTL